MEEPLFAVSGLVSELVSDVERARNPTMTDQQTALLAFGIVGILLGATFMEGNHSCEHRENNDERYALNPFAVGSSKMRPRKKTLYAH